MDDDNISRREVLRFGKGLAIGGFLGGILGAFQAAQRPPQQQPQPQHPQPQQVHVRQQRSQPHAPMPNKTKAAPQPLQESPEEAILRGAETGAKVGATVAGSGMALRLMAKIHAGQRVRSGGQINDLRKDEDRVHAFYERKRETDHQSGRNRND